MRRVLGFLFVLAFAVSAFAMPDTVTITWTVLAPNGSPATSGTVTAILSGPGTAPDGAGSSSVMTRVVANIASNGTVILELVPNDIITPADTYYTFQYVVRSPVSGSSAEKRILLSSPDPATITDLTLVSPTPGIASPISIVMDEASALTRRSKLNFSGAGVTCTDNAGQTRTDCAITTASGASITVGDAAGDTTTWPIVATDQTGSLAPVTDGGLTYNASSNSLTASAFVGALTGNASGSAASFTGSIAGDVTGTQSATIVADDSHAHTSSTISGIDVSADVNLAVSSPLTLTGDSVGIVDQGTSAQVLHGNASGNASFSAIATGDLPSAATLDSEWDSLSEFDAAVGITGTASSTTFWRGDNSWATPIGTGDVAGPGSSTDNAITRFDSTSGKVVQNSTALVDDTGKGTFPGGVDSGDPGDTARRVDLLGNTTELAGAALPAVGLTAWYALGTTAGNEVPMFRNGSVGAYSFITSRSVAAVTPAMVLGSPTDEYCLTYESAGATWQWQLCGQTGGRSLTDTGTTIDADAELYTWTDTVAISSPVTGDSGLVQMMFARAVTITRISCSTDAGTATIQFDERVAATPNIGGLDVMTSVLLCDSDEQVSVAFTNPSIASRVPMNLDIDATTPTPTKLRIAVEYTVDD